MRIPVIFFVLIFSIQSVSSQELTSTFREKSLQTRQSGMYVLGSWAATNIAVGSHGWATLKGEDKYFSQMNVMWNTVNISLAVYSLISDARTDYASMSDKEFLKKHKQMERVLLINAGLDVGYMLAGAYLTRNAHRLDFDSDLLHGYGNAMILQGAFLLVFDLLMYANLKQQRIKLSDRLTFSPSPIGLRMTFVLD